MAFHAIAPKCTTCHNTMRTLSVSANSQAQIQVDYKCFVCNLPLTQVYSILKLREWAERNDEAPSTLAQTALEKSNDDAFLRDMRILP
jgi:hypothetical protein